MAEENKSPEVEIDTDGVNEETISVEAPEVSNEAFEKKQEVDLGYIDVSQGGKSAKDLLQETKETPEEVKTEPKVEQKEENKKPQKQRQKSSNKSCGCFNSPIQMARTLIGIRYIEMTRRLVENLKWKGKQWQGFDMAQTLFAANVKHFSSDGQIYAQTIRCSLFGHSGVQSITSPSSVSGLISIHKVWI